MPTDQVEADPRSEMKKVPQNLVLPKPTAAPKPATPNITGKKIFKLVMDLTVLASLVKGLHTLRTPSLKSALRKYGRHLSDCKVYPCNRGGSAYDGDSEASCNCGLNKLLGEKHGR